MIGIFTLNPDPQRKQIFQIVRDQLGWLEPIFAPTLRPNLPLIAETSGTSQATNRFDNFPETASVGVSYTADLLAQIGLAALELPPTSQAEPWYLVAEGEIGKLLPRITQIWQAARRPIKAYALIDAQLPITPAQPAMTEIAVGAAGTEWPDAPCTYLATRAGFDAELKVARLKNWQVYNLHEE